MLPLHPVGFLLFVGPCHLNFICRLGQIARLQFAKYFRQLLNSVSSMTRPRRVLHFSWLGAELQMYHFLVCHATPQELH